MGRTLILTGWGNKDYACGAALAWRHYREADILGVSKRRLPEFLENVKGYTEIAILGVSLTGDAERLAKALQSLRKRNVLVRWISVFDFPEWMSPEIRANLEASICGSDMLEAVSLTFDIPGPDIGRILTKTDSLGRRYTIFLDAAMYFYRNFQDEQAYPRVIRHIAATDAESQWTDAEHQMLEHYRKYGQRELVGKSKIIGYLHEQINKVARHPRARVLIFGESGTGKETIAQQIHFKSAKKNEPFIAFNCASVTANLLESRFLGYEKGAFTGATESRAGVFEVANGGTLFLDEISEMPLEAQGVLLRVLEGGRFTRVGGTEEVSVNVRLITATNRDLAELVREGKFREDLYHRLCVVQIHAPSLREHKEDIEQIANGRWLKEHHRRLEAEQIAVLKTYDYPGNVRELINILDRASVLDESDFAKLLKEHKEMTAGLRPETEKNEELPDELEAAVRIHVKRIYEKYDRNLTRTAEALKAARNTVKKYLED